MLLARALPVDVLTIRLPRLLLPKLLWLPTLPLLSETVLLRFNLLGFFFASPRDILEEPVLNSSSWVLRVPGADTMASSIVLDLINLACFFPLLLLRELFIPESSLECESIVVRLVGLFPLLLLREGVAIAVCS